MPIFSKNNVNNERQIFIDVVKTFSILFMVMVHIAMSGCDMHSIPIQNYIICVLLGGIYAAPVFMFCMGIGITYSRSGNDPSLLVRRGGKLYLQGVLLNTARSLVIGLFAALIFSNKEMISISITNFLMLDILFFAGISFMLIALLKKLKLNEVWIFLIALLMSGIGFILDGISVSNPILEYVVAHFVHVEHKFVLGCNPLLTWFLFPAGGMLFGKILRHCTDTSKLFRMVTPTATAIAAIYLGYSIGFGKSFYAKMTDETALMFKAMPIIDGIGTLFVIVSFIGICYYLTALMPERMKTWFSNTSNDITRIYVIHWLILNSFVYFVVLPMGALPGLLVYPCTVALFVVSSLLARLLKNKKQGLLL